VTSSTCDGCAAQTHKQDRKTANLYSHTGRQPPPRLAHPDAGLGSNARDDRYRRGAVSRIDDQRPAGSFEARWQQRPRAPPRLTRGPSPAAPCEHVAGDMQTPKQASRAITAVPSAPAPYEG
jgi:hypothetical protein